MKHQFDSQIKLDPQMKKELRPQIKEVWKLSLPAILTQITTIAMQYIDSAMVGALGARASASIGLVASSTWLLSGTIYALSAGFSVQVAHHIGGRQDREARNVIRHGLAAALILSAVLCTIGLLICRPLPAWLGGDVSIRHDATAYYFMFALMLPFMQLNSLTSSCLQCSGDMITPSVLNAVMCVLDVLLNALFIPRYGVLGAGMGTTLACAIISLIMVWCCCVRNPRLRLTRAEKGAFDCSIIKKAIQIGAPVAVQELAMNGAMVTSITIIAPLGPIALAAHSFAITAESICYMPGHGIASAATTLVGRSVGAGDIRLAKRYGNICTALGALFMGLAGALMMLICPLVFTMMTPDRTVRKLAAQVLRIELLSEPLYGASIVAAGALRGTGDTLIPSLLNLVSIWIVRLGLASLLVKSFGLHGMWIAMSFELCIRGLLMLYRQRTSKYYLKFARPNAVQGPEATAEQKEVEE